MQAVQLLLKAGADVSQPLTHGIATPLCAAISPASETVRPPAERLALVRYKPVFFTYCTH